MAKNKVSYVKRPLAKRSIYCIGLAVCALGLFSVGMAFGIRSQGHTGLNVAAVGFCSLLLSIVSLWYGLLSFMEKDKNYILAKIGVGIGGTLVILWTLMIIVGLSG